MPELPEVETVVRQLRTMVCFKTIEDVVIKDSQVISHSVKKGLPARIIDIMRRGKSIVFTLDTNSYLVAHLRMTGHFHYVPPGSKVKSYQKYLSATFHLDDGSFFTFNEIRRFGGIKKVSAKGLENTFSQLNRFQSILSATKRTRNSPR